MNGSLARLLLLPRDEWHLIALHARNGALRQSAARLTAIRNSQAAMWFCNGFFCVSLWVSLLITIYLCRGWVGLFFSGQVLSTAACLFQRLARKTQNAFSLNKGTPQGFQEAR